MKIRKYKSGEEKEIWELYRNTVLKVVSKDYDLESVKQWAPQNKDMNEWRSRLEIKQPYVAEVDGVLVGFAELEADGHIDCFYCHHLWIGKGVGKALFHRIEQEAKKQSIQNLYLEASITAKEFFLKNGFEIIKEENKNIRGAIAKRYIMTKNLS
jgi:putative acetyltransferase